MKFGIRLPNSGPLASRTAITRIAKEANELEYDSVWVHDHTNYDKTNVVTGHISSGCMELMRETGYDKKPDFFEALTTLAYVSGITDDIKLGTAVLVLPQRNPVLVAKQVATLHLLSGERVILGVGIGSRQKEYDVLGTPYERRGKRLDEYVQLMRRVWTDDAVNFNGEYVTVEDGHFFPKTPHIPVWFGGYAEESVRRVAKSGNGWIPGGSVSFYEKMLPTLTSYAKKYGRSPRDIEIGCEIYTTIAKTTKEAVSICGSTISSAFGTIERGLERGLVGSPHDIGEKIEKYKNTGVEHFELKLLSSGLENMIDMIELFSREVVPCFK